MACGGRTRLAYRHAGEQAARRGAATGGRSPVAGVAGLRPSRCSATEAWPHSGVQREEGWTGQSATSKNRGVPVEVTAPGGTTVRRHAIRGVKSAQMLTDMLIAVIPTTSP